MFGEEIEALNARCRPVREDDSVEAKVPYQRNITKNERQAVVI